MTELIIDLKQAHKILVKKIRCDGAAENHGFEAMAKEKAFGLIFEYTAKNTPQHNGKVERKFQTLFG